MTLSFKTRLPFFPYLETYFIQAIWNGLMKNNLTTAIEKDHYETKAWEYYGRRSVETALGMASFCWDGCDIPDSIPAKIHTIREDKADRWRPGVPIHFVIGNRTKKRFQFAPVVPVISTQHIVIERNELNFDWDLAPSQVMSIKIDGREGPINLLRQNDGFHSMTNFIRWWPAGSRFEGKIIHWTDFKY